MAYWLLKSEPDAFSWQQLVKDGKTSWTGVRNYTARNNLAARKKGDQGFFYHSNEGLEIVGIVEVTKTAYPDPTAWDPKDHHYDPKSDPKNPSWLMVDVKFVEKFLHFVSLPALRANPKLKGLLVLKRGMRLSVQPVEKSHFEIIQKMGRE